jgi:hypothetical protein
LGSIPKRNGINKKPVIERGYPMSSFVKETRCSRENYVRMQNRVKLLKQKEEKGEINNDGIVELEKLMERLSAVDDQFVISGKSSK